MADDDHHIPDHIDDPIPIEDEVFQPNPLIVADIIFDEPSQQKNQPPQHTTHVRRRGSEVVMDYTRHPLPQDTGQQHVGVHFEDGKTPRLKSYEGPTSAPGLQQPYPQPQYQPHGPYSGQLAQQPSYQQQAPYFPPPPNAQQALPPSAPIAIPSSRNRSYSSATASSHPPHGASPQQGIYGSPGSYQPAPTNYGSWPHPGYVPPPPPGQGYLPGPGAAPPLPWSQQQQQQQGPQGYYAGGPYDARARTGSGSSYNSHSSKRWRDGRDESPIFESDEDSSELDDSPERRKRHRRHTHSDGSDKHHHHHHHHSKYSSGRGGDHATLGDTLALIWDGLSGNVKRR